ncbi:MAG: immunoglobulin-like domain-containing protein [Clostridium sp.]
MRKRKLLGMIVALGLAVNLSTGLVANATENVGDAPAIEQGEEKKEEVVKLTYNNSTQKVGEVLNLNLLNAKAINMNDEATKYIIKYGAWDDTENPIFDVVNKKTAVIEKAGVYNVVIQALKGNSVVAEGQATITVIEDDKKVDEAPVISGKGAIIKQYETFDVSTLDIKATDKEDGDITKNIVIDSKVDTSKAGIQSVYVSVKDSAGNESKEVFTVVVKESGRPVITGIANDKLVLKVGEKFDNSMLGVKATDKEDGDLTSKVVYEGTVDTSKVGTYKVTAKVSDKDNLETIKVFTVVVEEKAPVKPVEPTKPVKPTKPSKPNTTKPTTGDETASGYAVAGLVALAGIALVKKK